MLVIAAIVGFLLYAFGVNPDSFNLLALSLALFAAAFIVPSPFGMITWTRNQ